MQSIKRDLVFGASACALVFAWALVWGAPFISHDSGHGLTAQRAQAPQAQIRDVAVVGTLARQGGRCVLRDSAGQEYTLEGRLTAPLRTSAFDGKNVKVTGRLDESAATIHVASVEILDA
ncbi:MAG TPA: DUF5818 domain-containing protein [Terracidiphilus sp.]|nr:DUF5818 domain-containing protein [Terracidiphilus sp.]